ncbi:MAG TPA: DUF1598 domain-containing protein [Lacipirellulaceae bacterium]|nr:DUF1598 domain-containing protein [Lacipirellulaceae bacterium]HMP05406.1 DUF1598 domain-containing protein [Lacipirellulaceae bacterium]
MLRDRLISIALLLGLCAASHGLVNRFAHAQSVDFVDQRPFVIGMMPVVRGGAVGGVAVNARGEIDRAQQRDVDALRAARQEALPGAAGDVAAASQLRKVSLRRLDAALARHATQGQPLTPELQHLAGLQRVEYVFAYPESGDIVLAGPAEPWTVDDAGQVVGVHSALATMELVDLVAALRTIDRLLAGEMISCSIDPTPEGLQRFARLMRAGRASPSDQLLARMEQAVGPQAITLTGIAPDSHFAHVLVAADWQMKRLGMGLVESPVAGLASYLELLNENGATPRNAMPRWWIAYGDQPAERDDAGLAWRLSRPGLQVCTAASRLDANGRAAFASRDVESDPTARQWADDMTAQYDRLALVEPVFAQLRGCMDLALVTAVLASEDMLTRVGLELPMLLDESRLQLAARQVPQKVASQASAIRTRRGWVVSVSGGVELDVGRAVNDATVNPEVSNWRQAAAPPESTSWWWD